ncbi:hypothetical protein RBWH47_01487 [Rhodopirellula baltica WH47]|uniref:Uncharacterized protein n=1 Tax=Rhodopirellula baltica WH47 TaxID=991778 RepID=F2AKS3_RHOBT|nr:hypothetical protein RBWH47_01487 [Rhodopirellula baltica WH47]
MVDWQQEAAGVSTDAQHPDATVALSETDAAQQQGGCSIGQTHNASTASKAGTRSTVWLNAVGLMSSVIRSKPRSGRGKSSNTGSEMFSQP